MIRRKLCAVGLSLGGTRNSHQERVAYEGAEPRPPSLPPQDETTEGPLWRGKAIAEHVGRGRWGSLALEGSTEMEPKPNQYQISRKTGQEV